MMALIKTRRYADVDTKGREGKTGLYWAVEKNHASLVRLFLRFVICQESRLTSQVAFCDLSVAICQEPRLSSQDAFCDFSFVKICKESRLPRQVAFCDM